MSDADHRARNAAYQRAYRARARGTEPGRLGARLDLVISTTSKRRLSELAASSGETEKFTLESLIKQAHDLLPRLSSDE